MSKKVAAMLSITVKALNKKKKKRKIKTGGNGNGLI